MTLPARSGVMQPMDLAHFFRTQLAKSRLPGADPTDPVQRAAPHTVRQDVYGIAIGIFFSALGIVFLNRGGMITGGVAGVSLLLSYLVALPVGSLLWVVNAPFIVFAFVAMGRTFGAKTLVVSALLGAAITLFGKLLVIADIHPAFSTLAGGTTLGMGILSLARHNASLGGTGAVVLWAQRRYGINAGVSQMVLDVLLFLVSFSFLPWTIILWSLVGTLAMNAMLIAWHTPGRYQG